MTIKKLPGAPEGRVCAGVKGYLSPNALERWDSGVRAADDDDKRSISIYDVIGYDYWTGEGVTAKRVSAALRGMGAGPVTVNINSPGGDVFEGLAIYNLLREHKGEVTVKVMGLAASAASIIAMAGDKVEVGKAAFLMIHNTWVIAIGNRNELAEVIAQLEPFDNALADIYADRTGESRDAMASLMDAETWINGTDAVEQGFADSLLASDEVGKSDDKAKKALRAERQLEAMCRANGMPRSAAMKLIQAFKSGLSDSVGSGERDATERAVSDSGALKEAAAFAASLTNLNKR